MPGSPLVFSPGWEPHWPRTTRQIKFLTQSLVETLIPELTKTSHTLLMLSLPFLFNPPIPLLYWQHHGLVRGKHTNMIYLPLKLQFKVWYLPSTAAQQGNTDPHHFHSKHIREELLKASTNRKNYYSKQNLFSVHMGYIWLVSNTQGHCFICEPKHLSHWDTALFQSMSPYKRHLGYCTQTTYSVCMTCHMTLHFTVQFCLAKLWHCDLCRCLCL